MARRPTRGWCIIAALALGACGQLGPTAPQSQDPYEELYLLLRLRVRQWEEAKGNPDPSFIEQIENEIRNIANRNADVLLTHLQNHPETEYRQIAAFVLGFDTTKRRSVQPALVRAMQDGSPDVRAAAAYALGRLGIQPIPVEAYRALLWDASWKVKIGALAGLQWLMEPGTDLGLLEDIHGLLEDANAEVRAEAVNLLGRIAKQESVDPLLALIRWDREAIVRHNTALALMEINSRGSLPGLIELLRDPNTGVVHAAWYALRQITGEDLPRTYPSWKTWYDNLEQAPAPEPMPEPAPSGAPGR